MKRKNIGKTIGICLLAVMGVTLVGAGVQQAVKGENFLTNAINAGSEAVQEKVQVEKDANLIIDYFEGKDKQVYDRTILIDFDDVFEDIQGDEEESPIKSTFEVMTKGYDYTYSDLTNTLDLSAIESETATIYATMTYEDTVKTFNFDISLEEVEDENKENTDSSNTENSESTENTETNSSEGE